MSSLFSRSTTNSTSSLIKSFTKSQPNSHLFKRNFHITPIIMISKGDSIPSVTLKEDSPGNPVNIADEVAGKKLAVIVGVPAAFSPACSATHVPGYLAHKGIKEIPTYVVSVNDPFVMGAWKKSFEDVKDTGVRFLADGDGAFAKALDLTFPESEGIFGTLRNKRYAIVVEDGKASKVVVEPDNTGVNETTAEKVLASY